LRGEKALASYHLLPSDRGDLLFKLGRLEEAREEFVRAADLTRNAREQTLLLERAAACVEGDGRDRRKGGKTARGKHTGRENRRVEG